MAVYDLLAFLYHEKLVDLTQKRVFFPSNVYITYRLLVFINKIQPYLEMVY